MRIETPRGAVVHTQGGLSAQLIWNPDFQPRRQGDFNRAQAFVDNEVLRRCTPLVPMRSGFLIKSGVLGTIIGSGEVAWLAPYARYQYYGRAMAGRAPRILTDMPLSYGRGEDRGAYWFERMKARHGAQILAGARRISGGG